MLGSQALDVAIGMAVVFFVAAASSAVVDLITSVLKKRSRGLKKSVYRLLSGDKTVPKKNAPPQGESRDATGDFMGDLLKSSPIAGLAAAAKDYPSYIPAKNFLEGVLSIVPTNFSEDAREMEGARLAS